MPCLFHFKRCGENVSHMGHTRQPRVRQCLMGGVDLIDRGSVVLAGVGQDMGSEFSVCGHARETSQGQDPQMSAGARSLLHGSPSSSVIPQPVIAQPKEILFMTVMSPTTTSTGGTFVLKQLICEGFKAHFFATLLVVES